MTAPRQPEPLTFESENALRGRAELAQVRADHRRRRQVYMTPEELLSLFATLDAAHARIAEVERERDEAWWEEDSARKLYINLTFANDALRAEVEAWRACDNANLTQPSEDADGMAWEPDMTLVDEARRLRAQNEGGERG